MREDCRHFQSRTYSTGEVARFCVLNLAPEAPWRCPANCRRYEKDIIDGSFVVGSLVRPQVEEEPDIPEGEVATVLDAADLIVTAAGPNPEGDRTQTGDQALVEGLEAEGGRRARLERPLSILNSPRTLPAVQKRKLAQGGAAVLLVSAVLAGCSSSPSPQSAKATSSTVTPTTRPSSSALYNWQRDGGVPLDLGGGGTSTLSSIVAPGPAGEWLIAGTQLSAAGGSVATVWTSPDATRWAKSTLPMPAGAGAGSADAATNWGSRQVVVGSVGTGDNMRAAVWVSPRSGQPFLAAANNPAFDAPATTPGPGQAGAVMDAVTAGALGLFASGSVNGKATLWYSTDARQWQNPDRSPERGRPGSWRCRQCRPQHTGRRVRRRLLYLGHRFVSGALVFL